MWTSSKIAEPSTPAANKVETYPDTNDNRVKAKDYNGIVNVLTSRELANYIRNSGFWFAQRQAPASLATYSNVGGRSISADGWGISCENASIQYIRTDTAGAAETGLQGRFYGTFSKLTSTGKLAVCQVLEGHETQAMRGRTVRFQLWMKASAAKTIKIAVLSWSSTIDTVPAGASGMITAFGANGVDPTLAANFAFLAPKTGVTPDNATAGANSAACSVTTAWQRFGVVVDVPTSARNLIVIAWTDSQFAAADSVSMSQVSLTDGMETQDWAPQSYAVELARVQRSYSKSFNVDTAPAQSAGLGGSVRGGVAVAGAVASPNSYIRFPVQMRAAPTLTYYNPSAANAFVRNVTAATDATVTATGTAGETGTDVSSTGAAGWTVAQSTAIHYSADAEL